MSATTIVSLACGLVSERLTRPRLVRRDCGRPAVLLGWVTDLHGRRLWAEIVGATSFIRPDELADDDQIAAADARDAAS